MISSFFPHPPVLPLPSSTLSSLLFLFLSPDPAPASRWTAISEDSALVPSFPVEEEAFPVSSSQVEAALPFLGNPKAVTRVMASIYLLISGWIPNKRSCAFIAGSSRKVSSSWLHLGIACIEVGALIDLHLFDFELLPRKQIAGSDGTCRGDALLVRSR